MKKIDDILDEMLAQTREIPADDRVPYAFEKRIMAHIKDEETAAPPTAAQLWEQWSRMLWRAAVPCLAVLVIAAVWVKAPGNVEPAHPQPGAQPGLATHENDSQDDLEELVNHAIDPALDK
tara:strand:- start:405 stop:767 length:363 start_codon:yes stop_codon:yes gene_type:complete